MDHKDLADFSQKMVDLLVEEAIKALQAPDHEGMNFAACLIRDAQRYDQLYPYAKGVQNQILFDAADKLRQRDTF